MPLIRLVQKQFLFLVIGIYRNNPNKITTIEYRIIKTWRLDDRHSMHNLFTITSRPRQYEVRLKDDALLSFEIQNIHEYFRTKAHICR